jgi:hypothetical protein
MAVTDFEQFDHWNEVELKQLSRRLRRLCRQVIDRLPSGWDQYRTISFEESAANPTPPGGGIGYANAWREEEGETLSQAMPPGTYPEQTWSVTFYPQNLDALSDEAVIWVIAHELGHVAAGLSCGIIVIGSTAMTRIGADTYIPAPPRADQEGAADRLALDWGFEGNFLRFIAEVYES